MNKLYPWQQTIYQQLIHTFLANYAHHALLFKTESGMGTEILIESVANWLLCQQPTQSFPCSTCKSCTLFVNRNHPDFHIIESIEGKDIGVEQIREVCLKLQQYPQQGGKAVVYIKDLQRLTDAGANALLKTLEEPPNYAYFLLESSLQSPVLPTIQSRCEIWIVNVPAPKMVLDWLETELPHSTWEEREIALNVCRQRPLQCKELLESDRLRLRQSFLQQFWQFYHHKDVYGILNIFSKEKTELLNQLEWLDSFLSDSLKSNLGISTFWLNQDLNAEIVSFGKQLSSKSLLTGVQILKETRSKLQQINGVNIEIILLDCLTKFVLEVFEGVAYTT